MKVTVKLETKDFGATDGLKTQEDFLRRIKDKIVEVLSNVGANEIILPSKTYDFLVKFHPTAKKVPDEFKDILELTENGCKYIRGE